jgi:cysteinyl-tRNA synthetase
MTFTIHDTLRRETVPFEPREPGRAAVYVCGPTVYGDPHIGHGRFAVVFDVLNRYLRHRGYEVTFVMNLTDVDDKIIARSHEEGVSPFEVADRYSRSWNHAMDLLGVRPPDIQPRATGHIMEMQELISTLVDSGIAYASEGNVLFRVREFEDYGKLSHRRLEDAQQPADVAEVVKEDPADFALWKAAKEGEPAWGSPWGPGRPGWHIECSAMSTAHLGGGFDIHGGGVDLVFPHHENEIAQYEAATGGTFARHWMHNGMLQMSQSKMSKSIGNVIDIAPAVARWGRGPLRVWYASAAYRSPLTFDDELIDDAVSAFERLLTFVRNADRAAAEVEPDAITSDRHRLAVEAALDDDLNLPAALARLHDAVAAGNERLGPAEAGDEGARAEVAALRDVVTTFADDVLGIGIGAVLRRAERIEVRLRPLVEDLLARRQEARQERDFATADSVRDLLTHAGVVVEDRPGGARWHLEVDTALTAGEPSATAPQVGSRHTVAAHEPTEALPDDDLEEVGLPTADI